MTFEQQLTHFGCIRFGLPGSDERLLPWQQATREAGFNRRHVRDLEKAGMWVGGSPANWFGSFAEVSLGEVTAEVFLEGEGWQPLTIEDRVAA